MRILHFIYDSPNNPWLGGGGAYRTNKIYKLFPADVDYTIYAAKYPGAKNTDKQKFIGSVFPNYLISRLSYVLAARKLLKHSLLYDLVIEDFSPFSPLFLHKIVSPSKLLLSSQNYIGPKLMKRKFKLLGLLFNYFEIKGIRSHQNVLYVSQDLKTQINKNISKSFLNEKVIYNGIDSLFFIKERKKKLKNQILFLGRIDIFQKGLDTLIQWISELKLELKFFNLIIAGRGNDEKKLQFLIKKHKLNTHIHLIGHVSGTRKLNLLLTSQFLVMPSRNESWGITSIEAQSCRTPVLANNIPGLRETIKHNQTGLLYSNKKEFKKYFNQLLSDSIIKNNMQKHTKHFSKTFSWDNIAKIQLQYYSKIINQRKT